MNTSVYALLDPSTNEVRYVGKTTNPERRFKDHCGPKGTTHRATWLRSILPNRPIMVVLEDTEDWIEAEVFWIAYLKSLGARLTNHTYGGEGATGAKMSSEARAKMSAATKAAHADPEMKARRTATLKATMANPEFKARHMLRTREALSKPEIREKMSRWATLHQNTLESKERRSEIAKRMWTDPLRKAEMLAARTWQQSEEHKAKMSESVKAAHARPEVKAKRQATMSDPIIRAKMSEVARNRAPYSPEVIAKRGAAIKAAMSTPEYRAKRSQIAKDIHAKRRAALAVT